MTKKRREQIIVGIKSAGEMASATAWRLHMAGIRHIFMMETRRPAAVRRNVSFSEAIFEGRQTVEGIAADLATDEAGVKNAWRRGRIAVLADPEWNMIRQIRPDVVIDAIIAKKNMGTRLDDARLTIGFGPGFEAGRDVHMVIETARGHDMGRIITSGSASPNTGEPGRIGGYAKRRVLRAPVPGRFETSKKPGEKVKAGQIVGRIGETDIKAEIDGVIRGLVRSQTRAPKNMKLGDIDPRSNASFCDTISDKARAISGSALEAALRGRHGKNHGHGNH